MREFVAWDALGTWKITPLANYNAWIQNANKILKLGNDFETAKAVVAHNFGLQNVTFVMSDKTTREF